MNIISKADGIVRKGNASDAQYVGNSIEEIVKQLSVNKQHIEMFCAFFLKVLDRLFGEDVTASQLSNQQQSNFNNWQKGVVGGWLRQLLQNGGLSDDRHGRFSYVHTSPFNSLNVTTLRLIRHFVPHSAMFDLLSKLEGGCEVQLSLLPFKTQLFLTDHPVYDCLRSDNHLKVCKLLIKSSSFTPNHRLAILQRGGVLVSSFEYFLVCLMRYPGGTQNPFTAPNAVSSSHVSRFGEMSDSTRKKSPSINETARCRSCLEVLHRSGVVGWVDGVPYLALLQSYLAEYFPSSATQAATRPTSRPGLESSTFSVEGQVRQEESSPLPTDDHEPLSAQQRSEQEEALNRHRELFLRLAVEYWVDTSTVVRYNHANTALLRRQMNNVQSTAPLGDEQHHQLMRPVPTEVVLLDTAAFRWTIGTVQCTYMLVQQLLAADKLDEQYRELCVAVQCDVNDGLLTRERTAADLTQLSQTVEEFGSPSVQRLQLLQQPLFDMLRCIFARGDQSSVDAEVVLISVEVWLLYIQPWTAQTGHRGGFSSRNGGGNSFASRWKAYVAHNLHFYTTLLACYFKMVSKSALSATDFQGSRNLFMLERVLQAFAPLVPLIDELTDTFKDWYLLSAASLGRSDFGGVFGSSPRGSTRGQQSPRHKSPGSSSPRSARMQSPSAAALDEWKTGGDCYLMTHQHKNLFPDGCVDELADCGIVAFRLYGNKSATDVVSNLHNMKYGLRRRLGFVMKQVHYVLDQLQLASGISLADSAASEPIHRVDSAIAAVTALFPEAAAGVCSAMDGDPASHMPVSGHGHDSLQERSVHTGRLTAFGRNELLAGKLKCSPNEVVRALHYIDPLELPLCSFEWDAATRLLIRLSHYLNERLGLPKDKRWVTCPAATIVEEGFLSPTQGSIQALRDIVRDSFRFNLRCLGHVRVVSFVGLCVLTQLLRWWSNIYVSTALLLPALFLVATFYKGTLPKHLN